MSNNNIDNNTDDVLVRLREIPVADWNEKDKEEFLSFKGCCQICGRSSGKHYMECIFPQ